MEREELKGGQESGTAYVGAKNRFHDKTYTPVRMPMFQHQPDGPHFDTAWCSSAAIATLYSEAHNVANRTGLWPNDMEQRIKALEDALQKLLALPHAKKQLDYLDKGIGTATEMAAWSAARALLDK